MTVRDWLQLLIVPFALAVIGFSFTMQQDARQQKIEDQRAQQAQKIENQRAEAERKLAEQRAQDEALQAYLDQMSALLLEKGLRASDEDSEVRTLARARTLTVLERLDPSRKTEVMQFLVEAELVQGVEERAPIIDLRRAALSDTTLNDADLSGATLSEADLRHASLDSATLSGADLFGADLFGADLFGADLIYASLSEADLSDAVLRFASMSGADLSEADLFSATLSDAVLSGANLNGADLNGADLFGADLSGAQEITAEELEQQARFLNGVTMPNGQKYEDWLKKSKGRVEDGGNSGPS
jgi:uncharacterized protein YjbI with pentapeptide repeats